MKRIGLLAGCIMVLAGCAGSGGSIPVTDSGRPVSNEDMQSGAGMSAPTPQTPQTSQRDEGGVVVLVPDEDGGSSAIESYPLDSAPVSSQPSSGAPSSGSLQQDEQLGGPVLALLTSARQHEGSGDLNSASASLERALRIAPREPQVLYRLAQVRLDQGDAAQAEQLARRGLSYAAGRPTLQAGLWGLVADARERQGDAAGAAQARQRAKVAL
ncbi:tetratricopeptide repeat protein [Pseudomonas sp. FME51]|uniref:tetratricopeptide repeat protein n=1 Tax=Pseudomonas sp. FME51 TaxID=2742609 RepID=UPI0039B0D373